MKISNNLVELIGIIIGDGYVHKTSNKLIISGSLEDGMYYKYYVAKLLKNIFEITPKLYFQKNKHACYISLESKEAISKLLGVGFSRGQKNYKIPKKLMKKSAFKLILRGVFDTDGSLKFSKQTKSVNYYPRIQIALSPSEFSEFISVMLTNLGFQYGKWTEDNSRGFNKKGKLTYYHISGKENLEKWMKEIGSSNPVHLTKYLFWKKKGYYKPKMKLKERIKLLKTSEVKNLINIKAPLCSGQA